MNAFQKAKLHQLEKMLRKGMFINQASAAQTIDCNPRTVRRLMQDLKAKGLRFHYAYDLKRYVFDGEE
ncbi:hypothetical protein [Pedobacter alpinus]|uniref:HTH domain-containing protein n=1 Tax=Pedobacter alpinus TaxID=1590643 RepID=A0ABW5TP92_9SPHI